MSAIDLHRFNRTFLVKPLPPPAERARPRRRAERTTLRQVLAPTNVATPSFSPKPILTIPTGGPPPEEAVAYDFASALVNGGVLPELSYKAAVQEFGEHGAAELSYLVAVYCLVSVTLNTFDVPVPG